MSDANNEASDENNRLVPNDNPAPTDDNVDVSFSCVKLFSHASRLVDILLFNSALVTSFYFCIGLFLSKAVLTLTTLLFFNLTFSRSMLKSMSSDGGCNQRNWNHFLQ